MLFTLRNENVQMGKRLGSVYFWVHRTLTNIFCIRIKTARIIVTQNFIQGDEKTGHIG